MKRTLIAPLPLRVLAPAAKGLEDSTHEPLRMVNPWVWNKGVARRVGGRDGSLTLADRACGCLRGYRSLKNLNDSRLTLKEFNNFSAQTLGTVSADFAKHTKAIRSIKSDLDYIFKHTRYEA